MARADTVTLLPLDRWAYLLQIEPRHFNGITTTLRPARTCPNAWMQYGWQAADRISREDVAIAIAQAEQDLIRLIGYLPVPSWTEGEVVRTTPPADPTLIYVGLENPRGLYRSVQTRHGMVISGGTRAATLIGTATIAGGEMVWDRSDPDNETEYPRTATITLATSVTDTNEIRCYFSGHGADDAWEIRPLRSVSIADGTLTVTIDRHLLVDPDLWEAIDADNALPGEDDDNFVDSVEVYRVANDPSDQATLQWERVPGQCGCGSSTCPSCAWQTQTACLQTRDPRLGIVTYQPAEWDEDDEEFDPQPLSICRAPERVRLNYRSGYQSASVRRPLVEMDPLFERIITYYSLTLLDRPICECKSVEVFTQRWMTDRALQTSTESSSDSYKIAPEDLRCPWGTREGAIWAYRQAVELAIGRGLRV